MAFETMNDDMNIIAKLPDEPNDEGGMTAGALKATFDKAGMLAKTAINKLIAALGASTAAGNIGFAPTAGVPKTNVQDAIENVQSQIAGVSQGAVANGSITSEKLEDGAVTAEKIADGAVTGTKIAELAISGKHIQADEIAGKHLKAGSVTAEKIAEACVTTDKMGDKSVTTGKIADAAVTNSKLSDGVLAIIPTLLDFSGTVTITPDFGTTAVTLEKKSFFLIKAIGLVLIDLKFKVPKETYSWSAGISIPTQLSPIYSTDEDVQLFPGCDKSGNAWSLFMQGITSGGAQKIYLQSSGNGLSAATTVRVCGWYKTNVV